VETKLAAFLSNPEKLKHFLMISSAYGFFGVMGGISRVLMDLEKGDPVWPSIFRAMFIALPVAIMAGWFVWDMNGQQSFDTIAMIAAWGCGTISQNLVAQLSKYKLDGVIARILGGK